jgi:hypothetical protein
MIGDMAEPDMKHSQVATLVLLILLINIVSSEMDINYSHSIMGTGTIVTDYNIESHQNSEASGKVRATGEMMNRYIFQSSNGSRNLTMRDEFTFSKAKPEASPLASFPRRLIIPGWFRVVGQAWAEKLKVLAYKSQT